MITYIPFLKAKSNEINAIGELVPAVRKAISPFFDYPRKPDITPALFKDAVEKMVRSLAKHVGTNSEFYFDNYDLSDKLTVGGKHNYRFLLESLNAFPVIPVVAIDRSTAHIDSVLELKMSGEIKSNVVTFRVTPEYFESYAVVKDDIVSDLKSVFGAFDSVDLIFDCRICTKLDRDVTAAEIHGFSRAFCAQYNMRRIVIAGSSIPASVGDILQTQTTKVIPRHELDIYRATRAIHDHELLIFGDYCTVSPLYSDVNISPQLLQNVMTAKLCYTTDTSHYFVRGGGLKTKGRAQYFAMAKSICSQDFFRGGTYSAGDAYFYEKSLGLGGNCQPNTVIKPSVNSHISYVVLANNI